MPMPFGPWHVAQIPPPGRPLKTLSPSAISLGVTIAESIATPIEAVSGRAAVPACPRPHPMSVSVALEMQSSVRVMRTSAGF